MFVIAGVFAVTRDTRTPWTSRLPIASWTISYNLFYNILKSWAVERCVRNCTSSTSISCLPTGHDKTEIQRFQVVLDRYEPSVTWSSWWSSTVDRWSLDCCHDACTVVVLTRWTASNEPSLRSVTACKMVKMVNGSRYYRALESVGTQHIVTFI